MTENRIYKLNVRRLVLITLPTWLRRPLATALLYAGAQPLARLVHELRKFREDASYRMEHNGQVCKLRGVLNDTFDPKLRRINVEDEESAKASAGLPYMREVERWLTIPRRESGRAFILNRRGYGGISGQDFWVTVPFALRGEIDETRLTATVNRYKLASKRWTIKYD